MGSTAVAPQPHGAEEARGGRAAGHVPGPGAARFRAPGPENGPDPGQQSIKMRRVNGRRENPGWERGRGREGEGKAGTSSFPTARSGKDGERREPKHPLPLARAPSLLRSRTSQHVATETPPRPEGRDLREARRIHVLGELPLVPCQWGFSCGQAGAKGIQPSGGAFPTSASSSSGMRKQA